MATSHTHLQSLAALVVLATGCIDTSGLVFDQDGPGAGGGGGTTSSAAGGHGGSGTRTYQSEVLDDGPIAYWPLDTTVGAVTPDVSGNGHDANLDSNEGQGTLTFDVAATVGTGVTLASGASLFVGVPHPLAFGDSSYTLEAWVRVDSGTKAGLWSATEVGGTGAGFSTSVDGTGFLHKRYDGGGNNESMSQEGIVLSTLRHVVVTYDRDDDAGQLYVDGQALRLPPDELMLSWDAPGATFLLGSADMSSSVTFDEVAVYDKALSADRVAQHYACATACD